MLSRAPVEFVRRTCLIRHSIHYRDVLAYYGAVALPCRVKDPDRKGKVEAGVGHAQKTPLKGQRFESHPDSEGGPSP